MLLSCFQVSRVATFKFLKPADEDLNMLFLEFTSYRKSKEAIKKKKTAEEVISSLSLPLSLSLSCLFSSFFA